MKLLLLTSDMIKSKLKEENIIILYNMVSVHQSLQIPGTIVHSQMCLT